MAATVVWCNECKTAIWAYDHMGDSQDIRGFANMASLPCPKCGAVGNFDGWSGDLGMYDDDNPPPKNVYDGWSLLKYIFSVNVRDGEWAISPDCSWFKRPEMTDRDYEIRIANIQSEL